MGGEQRHHGVGSGGGGGGRGGGSAVGAATAAWVGRLRTRRLRLRFSWPTKQGKQKQQIKSATNWSRSTEPHGTDHLAKGRTDGIREEGEEGVERR